MINPRSIAEENLPDPANCVGVGGDCQLNAECCPVDGSLVRCSEAESCESRQLTQVENDYAIEPFCLMWSEAEGKNLIDTIGFATLGGWPPIKPLPILSLLPKCDIPKNKLNLPSGGEAKCTSCEYILGFPITQFSIGPFPFWLTIQFNGIAFSWADNAKLAYGTNTGTGGMDTIEIWDGFRNQPLPEISDINFWVSFSFNIIPVPNFEILKNTCTTGLTPSDKSAGADMKESAASAKEGLLGRSDQLYLKLDFEIYVAFDKQTDGQAAGEGLASDFASGREGTRNLYSDGQTIWRDLQDTTSEDPCVIITMTRAYLDVPIIGKLVFGNSIGGFCNFSPEQSGIRCTPSGFFFNINQEFKIEGGVGGMLASILSDQPSPSGIPPVKAGNSIGIFQNPEGENEAVVLRLEKPATSLFGVEFGGTSRPVIHFQYLKGREVERRRKTILRTRRRLSGGDWSPWAAVSIRITLF